jgi:hypothetical protein
MRLRAQTAKRNPRILNPIPGTRHAFIAAVKHWMRILDWAVITALSLLIVAALTHAVGQLSAAGIATAAPTAQR